MNMHALYRVVVLLPSHLSPDYLALILQILASIYPLFQEVLLESLSQLLGLYAPQHYVIFHSYT